MTWTQETGNKELQVKNWHLQNKKTGKKNGSKKGPEKNWHLRKMSRNQKTESKELQLKNCHLKKKMGPKIRKQKGQPKKITP